MSINVSDRVFHDVQQNTEEWHALRLGHVTSSHFSTVMANDGKAFSDAAKKYAIQVALERITGVKAESYSNAHTERGHEQEPLARMIYDEQFFCEVSNGGFVECGEIGCSPDGFVGTDGLIEIKSVIPSVHFANVKRGGVDPAYKWQCIGNIWLAGAEWLDFISFCQEYPQDKKLFTFRLHRKFAKPHFSALEDRLSKFLELVSQCQQSILTSEYTKV